MIGHPLGMFAMVRDRLPGGRRRLLYQEKNRRIQPFYRLRFKAAFSFRIWSVNLRE